MKHKHWYNPSTHEVKKSEIQPEGYFKITPYAYGQILNERNSVALWKQEAESEMRWADTYFRKWQEAAEHSVHLTALRRGLAVSILFNVILLAVVLYTIGGR